MIHEEPGAISSVRTFTSLGYLYLNHATLAPSLSIMPVSYTHDCMWLIFAIGPQGRALLDQQNWKINLTTTEAHGEREPPPGPISFNSFNLRSASLYEIEWFLSWSFHVPPFRRIFWRRWVVFAYPWPFPVLNFNVSWSGLPPKSNRFSLAQVPRFHRISFVKIGSFT